MTHDDGIVKFYKTKNTGEAGDMPVSGRVLLSEEYFGNLKVGINRYYTALANDENIDLLIEIWPVPELDSSCIAIIEKEHYIIRQIQNTMNDDGLKIQTVALERNDNNGE